MMAFFRTVLTGPDNQTYDIGRVLMGFSHLFFYVITFFYNIISGHPFDPIAWATAHAALTTSGSASVAIKHFTEPKPTVSDIQASEPEHLKE
jgi:hypothetical protein